MSPMSEALSLQRIIEARETLTEAAASGARGAVGQDDAMGVLIEAKRNLTAMVIDLHGRDAWKRVLEGGGG